jgi:hypothetical protein
MLRLIFISEILTVQMNADGTLGMSSPNSSLAGKRSKTIEGYPSWRWQSVILGSSKKSQPELYTINKDYYSFQVNPWDCNPRALVWSETGIHWA